MTTPTLDPKLLAILACPACDDRPPVTLTGDGLFLVCSECRRSYPVQDGIPVLIVEEAILPEK